MRKKEKEKLGIYRKKRRENDSRRIELGLHYIRNKNTLILSLLWTNSMKTKLQKAQMELKLFKDYAFHLILRYSCFHIVQP